MPNIEDKSAQSTLSAAASSIEALTRLEEIAEQLGESLVAEDVRQLLARTSEGRFFVACIGQFKRGKSTLLNALVGEAILPTGVVPVTTMPTVLRYGERTSARIRISSKWQAIRPDELGHYVSERLNPENRKMVEGVEVFLPSPLLASGMCLVDTPGIGSVFAGNTETTRDFIPQIDAAILVLGADPPISGEELALIEGVAANVDEILVVLNKIDRVSLSEREQASAFAGRVIAERLRRRVERIYEVSAAGKLDGTAIAGDWGLLVEKLESLAGKSGPAMTCSAAERGMLRFSASLRRAVEQRIRALNEPIATSEQRIAGLRQTAGEAEQWLRDLGSLFSAEQMRLSNTLLFRRKEFLRKALPLAHDEFGRESRSVETSFGPAKRRQLMSLAQSTARRHVMPWLDAEEAQAEQLYAGVTARFVNLVNGLLQRIAEQQPADFAEIPRSLDAQQGFRTRTRFFFHDMITIAQPALPLLYLLDMLMGAFHVHGWFQRDAKKFLEQLLDTNASRAQGDVEQRVLESRLRLESEVRRLLREVSASAEQALSNAKQLMAAGNAAVQGELERLNELRVQLNSA